MYDRKFDVIVAGGGPAGVAAAIAASRSGAKTLLVEQYGFLGGTPVNALIPVLCPFSDRQKAIVQGIGLEILERMKRQSFADPQPEEDNGVIGLDWVVTDPEILKRVLDEMVQESGVQVWLHAQVTEVTVEQQKITSLHIWGKDGMREVTADVFIDCTGDADVAARAGAEFEYGSERGFVQGMTLCFRLGGVDGRRFLEYKQRMHENGNLHVAVQKAKEENRFPLGESQVSTFVLQNWDMAAVNFGHIFEKSPISTEDLTAAEMEARKKIPELITFFKTYVPGMEKCYLVQSGPAIGVRESRRIVGKYRITREDYQARREFTDGIARYAYPIDVHADGEKNVEMDYKQSEYVVTAYAPGESYTIPYRALLPKKLDNLIVAGRSVSSDRAINGSLRVIPACFAMGQAAGCAAALSVKTGCTTAEVDVEKLRGMLLQQGACL